MAVQGLLHWDNDEEECFEIDINEQEPAFLKGQSTKSKGEVSPVRIVANPEGSLQVMLISEAPSVPGCAETSKASAGGALTI